jgi:serine/threonine protein kinase
MKPGTGLLSDGILRNDKMFDPTQTQPLSWRMHQGKAMPWEEVPIDPPDRHEPTIDSAPPDRLSDRGYRLHARLGSGRLGPIYEAQDELSRISGSQHFAAIQLIDATIASRPGFAEDFERGAAELKSVKHPNIVKLLEYGHDRNRYYLVNELLESASLRFVLNDVNALPPEETTAVLRAVGDALQHLHAKSIVHGNLRPENVLVTFGYDVKLLDIVPNGWLVNPNDALGVPARAPDKRDDVFGLACLGYEMLSGRHPFNGNTALEATRAGLEPARIEGIPNHQWLALANALALHRDDRTPNVAQFLDEFGVADVPKLRAVVNAGNEPRQLQAAPASGPSPAPATALPPRVVAERPASFARQRRGIAGRLFVLLMVIGLGAAAWFYQDPLRQFASDLMAEVDTRMSQETAVGDRAAGSGSPQAPLAETPAVTEDAPVTVLAPGAAPAMGQAPMEPQAPGPGAAAMESPAAAPGASRFAFQRPAMTVHEGDVAARIVIQRSGDLSGAAAISWWTAGGTAVPDRDYADLGVRIEHFEPGEENRTVYVPLTNDAVPEPARSFTVLLGRGAAATAGGAAAEMRVDIVDDD